MSANGSVGVGKLMNDKEVAAALPISRRTVWRLLSEQKLAKPVKVRGCTRWLATDVDAYVSKLDPK